MSRVLLKKIFSRNDFLKATRVERMYMHMLQPSFELTEDDAQHLDLLKATYMIVIKGKSRAETARLVKALTGAKGTSEYRLIEESQRLFGNFEQVNKLVQRGILRDKLNRLLQIAEGDLSDLSDNEDPEDDEVFVARIKDTEPARKIIETLIKLDRLDLEEVEDQDTTIPELIITSDPKVLHQAADEIEEAEYDDD